MTRKEFELERWNIKFRKGDSGFVDGGAYSKIFQGGLDLKRTDIRIVEAWFLAGLHENQDAQWSGEVKNIIVKKWKAAENLRDFYYSLLERDTIDHHFTSHVWGWYKPDAFDRRRFLTFGKSFSVHTDTASVMVYSDNFSMSIGVGSDGDAEVAVIEDDPDRIIHMPLKTVIDGKFRIGGYIPDKGESDYLEGRYFVYSQNGYVVFQKVPLK